MISQDTLHFFYCVHITPLPRTIFAGAAEVRPPAAARSKAESEDAPDESLKATETNIGFEEAWELYARGEMDAKGMFRVLVGIHREGVRSSWPRVVAALPDDVVSIQEKM